MIISFVYTYYQGCLFIPHRPTLKEYHHWILTIGLPNGGWTLFEKIPD